MPITYYPGLKPHDGQVNGIDFDTELVNADGVCCVLYPVRGMHTVSDVAAAKGAVWVGSRDVVYFSVRWRRSDGSLEGS